MNSLKTKTVSSGYSKSQGFQFANKKQTNIQKTNALSQIGIQAKLKVGDVDDPAEKEADRIAEEVMRMPDGQVKSMPAVKSLRRGQESVYRSCVACDQKTNKRDDDEQKTIRPKLRTSSPSGAGQTLSPAVESSILNLGAGSPLPASERQFFEPRFDRDLSAVRVHTGQKANYAAQAINARAFTFGSNVAFGAGEYSPETSAPRKLLAHELTHVVQQSSNASRLIQRQPNTQAQLNQICYESGVQQPNPSAKNPELHPSYEQWLASFAGLVDFTSNDTAAGHTAANRFTVLGTKGKRFGDSTAISENEAVPTSRQSKKGEEFIDHPTNQWVINCLPPNLRVAAYRLPSDCADIAVILRHVWLAAHHRTEKYYGWTVGDAAGKANPKRVRNLINKVFTGNVAGMVNPYTDDQGVALTNFDQIQNLLHPGDILTWEHRKTITKKGRTISVRTGGHTQTISEIERNSNTITAINVLQGNQPIFSDAATAILQSQGKSNTDPNSKAGKRLRNLPSRRIENDTAISRRNIPHPVTGADIWGEVDSRNSNGSVHEFTVLTSSGPPKASKRPKMQKIAGQKVRRLSDWFAKLASASATGLHGVLEAALLEARSIIDGGNTVTKNDATELGTKAGENLWSRATAAVRTLLSARKKSKKMLRGDVGTRTHFDPLHNMRAMIRALGGIQPSIYLGNPNAANSVRNTFTVIDNEFNFAARGGSSISFNRKIKSGKELVKVLVTGFDPFSASPPPAGDWNPAGATAMALDNKEIGLGDKNKAAVESFVFPVSFAQFGQGIVERVVKSSNADAVLTVSLSPGLASNAPVQIEQFTVGVNKLQKLQPHRIFPPEPANPQNLNLSSGNRGIPGGGDAIIETGAAADLAGIAADTEQTTKKGIVTTQKPTVASNVNFKFASKQKAQQLVTTLGLSQTVSGDSVSISDPKAIRTIMKNSARITDLKGDTADIEITLNNTRFRATILGGPGGSFLSNEVAFRTQRQLRQQGSSATSFHTHVPPADAAGKSIPQSGTKKARRTALWSARNTVNRLVTTMKRIIRAVGVRIVNQRKSGGSSGP